MTIMKRNKEEHGTDAASMTITKRNKQEHETDAGSMTIMKRNKEEHETAAVNMTNNKVQQRGIRDCCSSLVKSTPIRLRLRSSNLKQNSTSVAFILIDPPYKSCKWKYYNVFYFFRPTCSLVFMFPLKHCRSLIGLVSR